MDIADKHSSAVNEYALANEIDSKYYIQLHDIKEHNRLQVKLKEKTKEIHACLYSTDYTFQQDVISRNYAHDAVFQDPIVKKTLLV